MSTLLMAVTLWLGVSMTCLADCWSQAGARYNIDPMLLQAIAQVESGMNQHVRNHNKDGSYDVGLMQINNRHFPRLAAFGITEKRLIAEPCTSVMTGAWILAEFISRIGYGWEAVGAYNAGTRSDRQGARNRYIEKVSRQYRVIRLQAQQGIKTESHKIPKASWQ